VVAGHDLVEVPLDGSPMHEFLATRSDEYGGAWVPQSSKYVYLTNKNGDEELRIHSRTENWIVLSSISGSRTSRWAARLCWARRWHRRMAGTWPSTRMARAARALPLRFGSYRSAAAIRPPPIVMMPYSRCQPVTRARVRAAAYRRVASLSVVPREPS
jgi:hypothetical protein